MARCACGLQMLSMGGMPGVKSLLILSKPDWQEIKSGQLLDGNAGNALVRLMYEAGIPFPKNFRVTSLWKHGEVKGELDMHLEILANEMRPFNNYLVSGKEANQALFGINDSDWWGIPLPKSMLRPEFFDLRKARIVMPIPTPGTLMVRGKGETVLALKKFKEGARL